MGCTQQKLSSPSKNRNSGSITSGQPESTQYNNVIIIQQLNQKLIEQKIKQGSYSLKRHIKQYYHDQKVEKSRKYDF